MHSATIDTIKIERIGRAGQEGVTEEMGEIDGLPAYQYKKQFRKAQRKIDKPIKYIGNKSSTAELYLHMAKMIHEKKNSYSNSDKQFFGTQPRLPLYC